ncbi:amidohydrolase family protein, partial [Escherichia coli]
RAICADMSLMQYMRCIRFNISPVYTPEDVYVGNYIGALEALNAGITTLYDFSHTSHSPEHADEAIRGLRDARIAG